MKKAIYALMLTVSIIIGFLLWTVEGVTEITKCNYGYYVDVRTNKYKVLEPLEKITNNYLQIDSNE